MELHCQKCVTISFPRKYRLEPLYFWPIDLNDNLSGHVWIAAPLFQVIGLTIKQQIYQNGEQRLLPDYVTIDNGSTCTATIQDICSPEIRAQHGGPRAPVDLHFRLRPDYRDIFHVFPPPRLRSGG
jgi:hypothetical protein